MPLPPRYLNSVHEAFPDNQAVKDVYLFADGQYYTGADRHVLVKWSNGAQDGVPATQIIQLTGSTGNYSYFSPVVKLGLINTIEGGTGFFLGRFSRTQRDWILSLAARIQFNRSSIRNGCRVWTRDLLYGMVQIGLLDISICEYICREVPLAERVPES